MLAFIKSFYKVKVYKWLINKRFWYKPWVVRFIINVLSRPSMHPFAYIQLSFIFRGCKAPVSFRWIKNISFFNACKVYLSFVNCLSCWNLSCSCSLSCWRLLSWRSSVCSSSSLVFFVCGVVFCGMSVEVVVPSVNKE